MEILLWFCNVLEVGQRRGKGLLRLGKWSKKVGGIDDGSGVEEGGKMGGEGSMGGEGGVEGGGEKEKQVNLLPHQHFSLSWTLSCWLKL